MSELGIVRYLEGKLNPNNIYRTRWPICYGFGCLDDSDNRESYRTETLKS